MPSVHMKHQREMLTLNDTMLLKNLKILLVRLLFNP